MKTSAEKGYSVNTLTRLLGVNRRTLLARLEGVTPVKSGPREKLYRLSDAVQGFISQPLRGAEVVGLAEVRGRKLAAETELTEMKLQRQRGELVPSADVRDDLTEIIRSLYTRLAVVMPQQLGPRLRAKTAGQAAQVLRAEVERLFTEFRQEHVQLLAGRDAAEGRADDEAGA
jgi:hypothetical protein